jgi:hypothetical protein
MSKKIKTYLGDGVYITTDDSISDNDFILSTENGMETTNEIYLEREVAQNLIEFIERTWNINLRLEEESGY